MKICIIGKGASAMGVLSAIEDLDLKYDKIDLISPENFSSNDANFNQRKEKHFFKKKKYFSFLPQKINIKTNIDEKNLLQNENNTYLSLWGLSLLPFSKKQLSDNKINIHDMDEAYKRIARIIGISGNKRDSIEKYLVNSYINETQVNVDNRISEIIDLLNVSTNEMQITSGAPRLALRNVNNLKNSVCKCVINNCEIHKPFTNIEIDKFILNLKLKINFIKSKVLKINFTNKEVIFINTENKRIKKNYDIIFVCSGIKNNCLILKNSLVSGSLTYKDNASYIFPILSFKTNSNKKSANFSLTNGISYLKINNKNHFIQYYSLNDYYFSTMMPYFILFFLKPFLKLLKKYLIIGVLYLDDECSEVVYLKKNKFVKTKNINNTKEVKDSLLQIKKLLRKRFMVFNKFFLKQKSSHHLGGIKINKIFLNDFFKKNKFQNVFFCGSSSFHKNSSSSPTMSIIAFSRLLALKKLKSLISR